MSLNHKKKLVALLGGRTYNDSSTLRKYINPSVRNRLKENGIDFIIASNNKKAIKDFKQITNVNVVELTEELHESFMRRQREEKPNLGAETREIINRYAIENKYDYVIYLDDNIERMYYTKNGRRIYIRQRQPEFFYHLMLLLFEIIDNSNFGVVGMEMAAFAPSKTDKITLTSGFAYSLFVHRVDDKFEFENSTEEDILMNIYNGINKKPSALLRGFVSYSKSGKKSKGGGNRKLYNEMLKENKRGVYTNTLYPEIYQMKVSYNVKSSTNQKTPFLQHKHTLKKPKEWDSYMIWDKKKIMFEILKFKTYIEESIL